ncbi:MAG: ABC transporter permease [Burkholderiales bacterium]|nr:ABC transporter permease [Burkholderiales bacterium]MDE2456168.1 ABC transporter permease [Burkholderiales bacterium]
MLRLILKRVLAVVPVMLTVLVVIFLLLHIGSGDPAALMAGNNASPEQIEALRKSLNLDKPLPEQFWLYARNLAHLDLGRSIASNRPVSWLIEQRIEPTLVLALATILLSVAIAVPAGVLAAWRAGTRTDRILSVFSVLGFSMPIFVVGYVLVQVFAIDHDWFPVQGYRPLADGWFACLRSITLPAFALSLLFAALVARITRAAMLEVLAEDFIRTARAKGAGEGRVLAVHAIKNVCVPVVTVIGTSFAVMLGGVVVTESVFNIPGMGRLTVDAIMTRDYPVVQGIMLVFSAVLIGVNLLVDLSYRLFDPRVSQ